jgi:hypothetical protein
MVKIIIDPKIKKYLRENPGAPFIAGSITLLLISAVLLSIGLSTQADITAEYTYYLLVIGVVLQFVSYLREKRAK